MFRALLTAYVTLVMLAGPSVCCCTTAHVFEDCFAGDTAGTEDGRLPCCCGHHAPAGDAGVKEAAAGGHDCPSAPGEKHDCPCRANKTHAVADTKKQVAELQHFRSLVPVPLDLPVAGDVVTDATPACPEAQIRNRASHFGSAHEILSTLRTYLI